MSTTRKQLMYEQREMLLNDYNMMEHHLRKKEKNSNLSLTYSNQQEAAALATQAFVEGVLVVTLISQTGAGKTGTSLRTGFNMCTLPDDDKIIDCENVFIITGMSDVDWQAQTQKNTLSSFKEQVFHRGKFPQLERILENGVSNALIIIDECHIGAEKEHKLSKMLYEKGLLDIEYLRNNNVKILEVSATPGHTLNDSKKWGPQNHRTIVLKPGEGYIGFHKMKEQGRLFTPYDLEKMSEVNELAERILRRWGEENPRWHLIRRGRKEKKLLENLNNLKNRLGWDIQNHDSKDRIEDIDSLMEKAPPRHTFIIIKEFWRAAKRVEYNFIGIVHEPKKTITDTSVETQSLTGTRCDYYPSDYDISQAPLIFTDIGAINEYIAWIDAGGDYEAVKRYRSRQINAQNGEITATDSFTHPSNVVGLESIAQEEIEKGKELLASKTRGVRVPEIISVTKEEIKHILSQNNEGKKRAVLNLLSRSNQPLATELATFECNEITAPHDEGSISYKNHIGVAVRKKENNEPCAVTIPKEMRKRGKVWNCFIDKHKNRLCFLIVGEIQR